MEIVSVDRKQAIANVFTLVSGSYVNVPYFPIFGKRLVEMANIQRTDKVLDVACGRGAILFSAAEQVGPFGVVIGIDIASGMVQDTQDAVREMGLNNVDIVEMDAENLEFPPSIFDHILCGFALFFFPNLSQALSEFYRVLKPGGCLTASTWGAGDPRWDWYEKQRLEYGIAPSLAAQPMDKPEDLCRALEDAGFSDIRIRKEVYDNICKDEDEWWSTMWSISGRSFLEKLSPPDLEQFKTDAFKKMRNLREKDGFHLLLEANFATGIKPS